MSALIRAYENRIADLERALEKEREAAAFAQDQLDVALKDRDHAERQLEEARGQLGAEHAAHLATGAWLADVEQQLTAARLTLNRIARGAELQANCMRDPNRTGGWDGAERVADAFDAIAERAKAALIPVELPTEASTEAAHLVTGQWLADMEAKVEEKAAEINRLQQSVYRHD